MPSPFPGMDPYLEHPALWTPFQHQLLACLYQILLPGLVDRYRARVGSRTYAAGDAELTEEFIEIRERSDGRLVTLVEVVSPANKATAEGRAAYLDQRKAAVEQRAGVVEIDLVLQGQPTLGYSRDGLPDYDYAVTVTRSTHPDRYEIYTATLQKRLPKFKVPLAPDDRDGPTDPPGFSPRLGRVSPLYVPGSRGGDALGDLQAAFSRAYDLGTFASQIDYGRDPDVPLSESQRRRVHEVLVSKGLRDDAAMHERIAVAAYYLWEQAGCPHGRDQAFWYRAVEQVRQVL